MELGTVLNIASLAYDVTKDLYKYYQAWKDCDKDVVELRAHLLWLQAAFKATETALKRTGPATQDRSEIECAAESALLGCREANEELKEALDKIKAKEAQPQTALQKLKANGRKAVYPFKKSTIQGLAENVESCRGALNFAVDLLGLNTGASTLAQLQDLDGRLVHGLDNLDNAINQLQLSHASRLDQLQAEAQSTKDAILQRHDKLEGILKTTEDQRKAQEILQSLDNETLHWRHQQVTDAYDETFEWILERESKFSSWLQDGSGIYCIRGKAGSGKSTLMKFLLADERTEDLLRVWAGSNELFLIQHFFWVAGTPLQKSNQGLLRALLHQTLQSDPNLVPIACSRRWRSSQAGQREWSTKGLLEALNLAITKSSTYICFLVDGLDEYHPESDHETLVTELIKLSEHSNVKIVVSCRPWNTFEAKFGLSENKLLLEDLTWKDIFNYIQQRLINASAGQIGDDFDWTRLREFLYSNRSWWDWRKQLPEREQEVTDLVSSLIEKSQGVFLWVSIITDGLCERLSAGQPIPELRRHVDEFPPELEIYFRELIFKRIQGTWISETAMVLKMLLERKEHISATDSVFSAVSIMAHFGACFLEDANFVSHLDHDWGQGASLPEDRSANQTVPAFVNACCKDIVVVEEGHCSFHHRTVYDFLRLDEMHRLIEAHVPQHFCDGYLSSRVILADLKSIHRLERLDLLENFTCEKDITGGGFSSIANSLAPDCHPAHQSSYHIRMPRSLLLEHGRILLHMLTCLPSQQKLDLSARIYNLQSLDCLMEPHSQPLALEILRELGKKKFKFYHQCITLSLGCYTLYHALTKARGEPNVNLEMRSEIIRLVLEHGEHPNSVMRYSRSMTYEDMDNYDDLEDHQCSPWDVMTPWEVFLEELALRSPERRREVQDWDIAKAMIAFGADLRARISVHQNSWVEHLSAIEILRMRLPLEVLPELNTILLIFSQPAVRENLKLARCTRLRHMYSLGWDGEPATAEDLEWYIPIEMPGYDVRLFVFGDEPEKRWQPQR